MRSFSGGETLQGIHNSALCILRSPPPHLFLYHLSIIFDKVLYKWQKMCYTKHTTQIEYYRFTRMCFYFDKNAYSPFCILVNWNRFVW